MQEAIIFGWIEIPALYTSRAVAKSGASGVTNLTPSMYASPADFDIDGIGFSLAAMLETSARIAVVAARDVRRKERRVCMSEQRMKEKVRIKKYEGSFQDEGRSERWRAVSKFPLRTNDYAICRLKERR